MKRIIYTSLFCWCWAVACFAQAPQKTTYTYDALNRLTKATYTNGNSITYNYDVLGNRTSVVVSGTSCQAAAATLSGSQTINAGQSANLSVSFTGDAPYTLVFNGQTYTGVTDNPLIIPVAPTATTTHTLTSVSNACGAGTVSGSATVTVNTTPCDPLEPNNTSATATPITGSTGSVYINLCFDTANDEDWFRFSHNGDFYYVLVHSYNYQSTGLYKFTFSFGAENITVETSSADGSLTDTFLELFSNDASTLLQSNNDINGGNNRFSRISYTFPPPCAPPQPPTVSSATINSGQIATLTASGCGGTVNWYSAASGGTSLATGTNFTTPALTATTTYYASCTVNNCVSATRGSGVVTVNGTTSGDVVSVKTGSWHDPSTWDCNCIPNNTHIVEIRQNHTVTVGTADANLKNLKYSGGSLSFSNQRKLCFGCSASDLTTGLMAYYPFNGNANDASGNGNHGVINGATLSSDRFGTANRAYSFDGNDGITSEVNTSFNFQEMTISMWVQIQVNAYPTFISLGPTDLTKDEYWFVYSAGLLVFYSGRDQRLVSNASFSESPNWKHVCILYKPNSVRLFVNGQLDSESRPATWSIPTFTGNALLQMGTRGPRGASLQGKIDDIRIYKRTLSDTEVADLYNVEKP